MRSLIAELVTLLEQYPATATVGGKRVTRASVKMPAVTTPASTDKLRKRKNTASLRDPEGATDA